MVKADLELFNQKLETVESKEQLPPLGVAWIHDRVFECLNPAKILPPERMPMIHEIKCHPQPYQALEDLIKTFEWRLNDRGYEVGDILHLHEWSPDRGEEGQYTGRSLKRRVTYILRGGKFGVPKKYVVMSLSPIQE